MRTASIYGAFNARWLEPEDVARSFVPTPHFKSLVRFQNSLLMGPRGCGKTTLLKMLTRRAQRVWREERAAQEPQWAEYRRPDFEAIYIPSDVRWNAELNLISHSLSSVPNDAERLQRALVAIASVVEATRCFQTITDEAKVDPVEFIKSLIAHLGMGPTIPSYADVRLRLRGWADEIQSLFVRQQTDELKRRLDALPASLTGHALNGVTRACSIFDEFLAELAPARWALCFDELEIAPKWLQSELLASFRSFDQRFLLKLTWSPVLPTDLARQQERKHDYEAIRMWHGHVSDAKPFCMEFSKRFIRDKFDNLTITPRDVFGVSPFAQDDSEGDHVYDHGGAVWSAMVRLAQRDESFRYYLTEHEISPGDPVTDSITLRDETFRKIKPLVLLRDTYLKDASPRTIRRSRKNPPIYCGEDVIYAMSEGNPRLLAGLLNDLLDLESRSASGILIRPELQSRVLFAASQRTVSGIKTYPILNTSPAQSLARLVERMGNFLHAEIVTHDFTADPIGSFFVDEDTPKTILDELAVGLLIGAFVHVKSSGSDIPSSVMGSRLRLTYMLSPYYKLPVRNFREARLSTALRIVAAGQRTFFR
jgi:hypothetical protein